MDKKEPHVIAEGLTSKCILCGHLVEREVRMGTGPQIWAQEDCVILRVQRDYSERGGHRWPKGHFTKREEFAVCARCVPTLRARGFPGIEHYWKK